MVMNTGSDDLLREDARLWAIRVADPLFADWESFTAWLEADPAHNAAYEAALDEHAKVDAIFDVPATPAWHHAPEPRRTPRWRMPAVAAGVAMLAVGGGWLALDGPAGREYVTAPGERRSIELADGSRIILNGGTRLTLDGNREVAMADGEALFDIRHDERDPFVVTTADGTRLVDVGTVFNVVDRGGALDVSVAEGAVVYRGGGNEVRLDAGEMLSRADANAAPVKRTVDPAVVGTWRTGYLQFADTPLSEVASDLSRNLGRPVGVEDAVATRRFSGTIMLDGGPDAVMARVAPLLDVRMEKRGDGWTMIPVNGARP